MRGRAASGTVVRVLGPGFALDGHGPAVCSSTSRLFAAAICSVGAGRLSNRSGFSLWQVINDG